MKGLRLTFHLAGINNQNFLMRDEETGSFWQQITGAAVSGPLKGEKLELVHSDELTLGLWRTEQPAGTVLRDLSRDQKLYSKKDWEVEIGKMPTVVATKDLAARELMLGLVVAGASRAYKHSELLKDKLILDRVGGVPVMVVLGPDNASVRAFRRKGEDVDFYRATAEGDSALLMDSEGGGKWNFQGCRVDAPGTCLERLDVIKDYWFDWRLYHPDTTVFQAKATGK